MVEATAHSQPYAAASPAADGAAPPTLEAVGLTKRYDGVTALDALDLRIEPGEVFCLLGANGAGKTTTINLFLRLHPAVGRQRPGERARGGHARA